MGIRGTGLEVTTLRVGLAGQKTDSRGLPTSNGKSHLCLLVAGPEAVEIFRRPSTNGCSGLAGGLKSCCGCRIVYFR